MQLTASDDCALLTSFPTWRSPILSVKPALEESMENFAELMQRLLEIYSGERRSPELIAEDERLMSRLQKRHLAGNPSLTVRLVEEDPFAVP